MTGPNGYYDEEVNFSHEGLDYYVKIEVYDHDQWKVMEVCRWNEQMYNELREADEDYHNQPMPQQDIWESMTVVSAELTKVMVAAIEKYVAELDKPYVSSDYDYKDLLYDQGTP